MLERDVGSPCAADREDAIPPHPGFLTPGIVVLRRHALQGIRIKCPSRESDGTSALFRAQRFGTFPGFKPRAGRDRVLAIRGARGSDVALKHSAAGIQKAMSDRLCALPGREPEIGP
jgi:hypothetical protein